MANWTAPFMSVTANFTSAHAASRSTSQTVSAPATLASLAASTARALRTQGRRTVVLGYDTSLYTGPGLAPGWPADYVTGGDVTPIVPLEVDQGRLTATMVQRAVFRLREDVQAKLSRLPLAYFDRQPRGEILSRVTNDIDNLQQSMQQTLSQLQQRVSNFRSQKEVIKAQYTAAQASAAVNAEAAGVSGDDSGAALARAQDKIANMQARAGALDELLQSGVLEDVGGETDDIQKELDEAGSAADVDRQLAAMKAQLAATPAAPELTAGDSAASAPAKD